MQTRVHEHSGVLQVRMICMSKLTCTPNTKCQQQVSPGFEGSLHNVSQASDLTRGKKVRVVVVVAMLSKNMSMRSAASGSFDRRATMSASLTNAVICLHVQCFEGNCK